MKIKRKVQLNLPQLIEWGFEQKELPPLFYGSREGSLVQFTPGGWVNITGIETTDTFTVTTEEEITEDTVIPRLITRNTHGGYNEWTDRSVKDFVLAHMEAIYIINDDLTLTLIWTKDKGLVE